MSASIRILIVAGLMTAALIYMIMDRVTLLSRGRVVTLQVIPVDPTDMFRGDYVILNYNISRLNLGELEGDDDIQSNVAYVTLKNDNGVWQAIAVHRAKPQVQPDQAVIAGTVTSSFRNEDKGPLQLNISYGIESFFVPQGQGRPIEDERNKDNVTVDVVLDDDGRAAIKALKVAGQPVYEETLF